jgi:hypothetical protein
VEARISHYHVAACLQEAVVTADATTISQPGGQDDGNCLLVRICHEVRLNRLHRIAFVADKCNDTISRVLRAELSVCD